MEREMALKELKKHVKNNNLLKHMYACEAVMRKLARHFSEDENKWGLAGLMHDIDYDSTKDDPVRHSIVGAQMLAELNVPDDVVYAVKVHNSTHGLPRHSLMDKALYATDPVTGLIVAGVLIRPDKNINSVDVTFLLNRFYEKSFARGANRQQIASCSDLGMSLEQFLGISLEAMIEAKDELGL